MTIRYSLFVLFISIAVNAVSQTFPCDNGSRIYFFRDTLGTNGSLSYIENYLTTPTITDMCVLPYNSHNGLGANPIDHYLYYLNGTKLSRLDASCRDSVVCTLTSSSLYGCFDPHGLYWTVLNNSLEAIDINLCTVVKGPFPITGSGFLDVVFNPFDCYIYVNNVRYDTTGVQDLNYSGILFVPNGTYGGVAVGSDGNLYGIAGMNTSGNLSVINLTNSTSTNVFNFTPGPTYARSDAASFPCYSVRALFNASAGTGCSTTISFTDSSQGAVGSWRWNFGDSLSATADTSSLQNPVHVFSGAGTYTVRLTVAIGGNYCLATLYSDSTTLTITVGGGAMNVNAGPDVTICPHDSTQLIVTGAPSGSTITWSPSAGLSCANCANPVATPLVSTAYVVTVADTNGCTGHDTVTVTVLPPLVLNFPRDYYICAEGLNYAMLTASGGTSYLWSPTSSLSDSVIANPVATPAVTTTYTVTVFDGTCTDTAQVTVHVAQVPIAPTIVQNGDTLSVPQGYVTYQWYLDGNPLAAATDDSYIFSQTGHYSVYLTDSNGCRVITASVYVLVTSSSQLFSGYGATIKLSFNEEGNKLLITGLLNVGHASITIYDVLGEKVYTGELSNANVQPNVAVDVGTLSRGFYFVEMKNNLERWAGRVVKE